MLMLNYGRRSGVPLKLAQVVAIVVLALAFLAVLYLAITYRGRELTVYLTDPAATFGFSPLVGLISHIGVFGLLSAGAVAIFAALHAPTARDVLLRFGVFNIVIAMDDFFMFHERIAPALLNIPEQFIFAGYGAFVGMAFLKFHRSLAGAQHIGLYVGMGFLAASVLADVAIDYSAQQVVFEDSLKFIGLIVWSCYWLRRAHVALRDQSDAAFAQHKRD